MLPAILSSKLKSGLFSTLWIKSTTRSPGTTLVGLYNGRKFPFDMTELRRLDRTVFEDCLAVLALDFQPEREVHEYFVEGNRIFENLASIWYSE